MTIKRLIEGRSYSVLNCTTATSVADAVKMLAEERIGALPVYGDAGLAGVLSERDVIYRLHTLGTAVLSQTVGEVMTAPPITVEPGTAVLDALGLMTRRRIRHLPVVEEGRVIGFVSIGDLVKYRIERIEAEAEAMRSYIQTA